MWALWALGSWRTQTISGLAKERSFKGKVKFSRVRTKERRKEWPGLQVASKGQRVRVDHKALIYCWMDLLQAVEIRGRSFGSTFSLLPLVSDENAMARLF